MPEREQINRQWSDGNIQKLVDGEEGENASSRCESCEPTWFCWNRNGSCWNRVLEGSGFVFESPMRHEVMKSTTEAEIRADQTLRPARDA